MIRVQGYIYDVVHLNGDLRRNVTIVCGTSYHLLGSRISRDSKIRFQLQVKSYISDWQFSKSQHLESYVSAIMPWAMTLAPTNEAVRRENQAEKNFRRKKINRHNLGGHERCKDSITIKKSIRFCESGQRIYRTYG